MRIPNVPKKHREAIQAHLDDPEHNTQREAMERCKISRRNDFYRKAYHVMLLNQLDQHH